MKTSMTARTRLALAIVLVVAGAALWYFPSDLIKLIVEHKPVVLGRYSRPHFVVLLVTTVAVLCGAWCCLANKRFGRQAVFQAIAMGVSTVATVVVLVALTNFLGQPRYIIKAVHLPESIGHTATTIIVKHRPPDRHSTFTFEDKPEQARSYPNPPPGVGEVAIELSTDEHGYRNSEPRKRYDIVAVGDSFTEGSFVSDGQAWSVLLSGMTGQSVYNLGVAGADPRTYLNNLIYLGLGFQPHTAIMMIYEGNDFTYQKIHEQRGALEGAVRAVTSHFSHSWITARLADLSWRYLEPVNAAGPVPGYSEQMGWMPVAVPTPNGDQYYAFRPKELLSHYTTEDEFRRSKGWKAVRDVLREAARVTETHDVRLLVVYVPAIARVVLPAVRARIPADQLRSFVAYRRESLPPPEPFKNELFANLDIRERLLAELCEREGIDYLSTTEALRTHTRDGVQVYYSYNQHWTPRGNEVVAGLIADYVSEAPEAAGRRPTP